MKLPENHKSPILISCLDYDMTWTFVYFPPLHGELKQYIESKDYTVTTIIDNKEVKITEC